MMMLIMIMIHVVVLRNALFAELAGCCVSRLHYSNDDDDDDGVIVIIMIIKIVIIAF